MVASRTDWNQEACIGARWHPVGLYRADLLVDLLVGLVVGASDDMRRQDALFSDLVFDHEPDVHVVKHDELFAAFPVGLDRLVFVHRTRQAGDQVTGEGQLLSGFCFVARR